MLAGIIIAMAASTTGGHTTSECAWYFVAYTFDTTLGVTVAIALHNAVVRWARNIQQTAAAAGSAVGLAPQWTCTTAIASCGDYGASSLRPTLRI